jgi:integrase
MRGHLEARGKNAWRAKVYLGRDATTGRHRYLTKTIHGTKRQAEKVLAQLLAETGPSAQAAVDGTFGELVEQWMAIAEDSLSPTTIRGYRHLLNQRILPVLGHRKVRSIRSSDLDVFYARLQRRDPTSGRQLSSLTIRNIHALVRRLLNQGVRWGWCSINVAATASPPRARKKEPRLPSPLEVRNVLALALEHNADLSCFLRLAVMTGARRGELCALRWTDLDLDAATVTIARSLIDGRQDALIEKDTKTHSVRRIALDTETAATVVSLRSRSAGRANQLGSSLRTDGFVFSDSPDGAQPWRPHRMTLAFQRICEQSGVEGVRTVSGRLGHASAATTLNVYAHFLPSSDADAAEALAGVLANTVTTQDPQAIGPAAN